MPLKCQGTFVWSCNATGEFDEIEVTCPRWPEAVRRLEPSLPALSQGEKENERQISSSGLLAMIYYNRGIDAFNDRRYADAVALNRKALFWMPRTNRPGAICWPRSTTGPWPLQMPANSTPPKHF